MKDAKITPLTIQQYADISEYVHDEVDRVEFAGMIAAKCTKHPEYGDIILISSSHGDCLMIHFADLQKKLANNETGRRNASAGQIRGAEDDESQDSGDI